MNASFPLLGKGPVAAFATTGVLAGAAVAAIAKVVGVAETNIASEQRQTLLASKDQRC